MFYKDQRGLYRCSLLDGRPWLEHGFGTRHTAAWVGAPLATLRQVHSDRWCCADGRAGCLGEGDALLSSQPGLMVGVRTADCLPILLADPVRRAVAAVHAGWRGLARGILGGVIEGMRQCFGSRPEELLAAVGPGICGACYEVGSEVAERFRTWLPELPSGPGPVLLDLAEAARRQLLEAGVEPCRLALSGLCTFTGGEEFVSYRRGTGRSLRMLSAIGVRPVEAP